MQVVLVFLVFSLSVFAQEKSEREVVIHQNIKLIVASAGSDIPEELANQYRSFLPILEQALKATTKDETDECSLTIRASAGVKEIGSAKTRRPTARISAFRRNSKQEFVGIFILYSYATSSMVNSEETAQFLKKQILDPAACSKPE